MRLCLCGCGLPALLRKYHNSTHQERAQKRRSRDRKRTFSVVELSISASIEIEEPSATAFGVPCTALVADLFADDQERFRAMQYVARREPEGLANPGQASATIISFKRGLSPALGLAREESARCESALRRLFAFRGGD